MKQRLRSWHRWVGLIAGVWLAWLGLTGSLLVVADRYDEMSHPQLHRVQARPALPWEARRQAVVQAYPEAVIRRWEPAPAAGRSERVLFVADRAIFVDPGDARILGEQVPSATLHGRMLKLHIQAEAALPYLSLAIALVLASGWYLQPLTSRRLRQTRKRALDIHRLVGWASVPGLTIALITGSALVEYKWIDAWLRGAPLPSPAKLANNNVRDLDRLLDAAHKALPKARLVRVEFPVKPGSPLTVRMVQPGEGNPKGRSFVYVNPTDASVLGVEDPLQDRWSIRLLQYSFRLHAGYYPGGGWLFLLGLCPAALWWTGWRMRQRRLQALKMAQRKSSDEN